MRYSIIVPVYNVEAYLSRCLESLLCQKGDFEILAIDDGSTDASPALCDDFGARYPEKIRVIHQENQGLGGARNTGISQAKGEYLLFVDSDDTVDGNLLERMDFAVERFSPQVVIFGMKSVDEAGNWIKECRETLPKEQVFSFEERKEVLLALPNACNKMFRAALFADGEIRFPGRAWYEDFRTTPKLLSRCERIVYLDELLYNYLQRSGSITNNKNLSRNEEILWAMDDLLDYFSQKSLTADTFPFLERLAVDHVLLAASVRVAKADPCSPLLKRLRDYMEEKFPDYSKNPALSSLSKAKKLALFLIQKRLFSLLRLLFLLKDGKRS